jgi:hypothetical protein
MRLSLVTCARNPEPARIARVLAAVESSRVPAGWERDYLVVDSASDVHLATIDPLRSFCARHAWVRVLRTELPGLAAARRAALGVVTGDPIVWVDDDNVLDAGYLDAAVAVAASRADVMVWGAGHITVDFSDGAPEWVERTQRATFQERSASQDAFGTSMRWEPYFPVGSGLVTRRAAMDRWLAEVVAGRASLTGRVGRRLSSGDDAQIIFGAVAAGAQVGVVAGQRLTHLIPRSRTGLRYLMRLEFALAESLRVARAECFPLATEVREPLEQAAQARVMRSAASAAVRGGPRNGLLSLARELGAASGVLRTHDRPEPGWLRAAVSVLGLR